MTWAQLIRKNVFRRKKLYAGYVASSSIAVMTLFMFMNFYYNPAVVHGYMTGGARVTLLASAWVVGFFAVFFIFYFHSAMLRLRSQEFGIFLVIGVTPKQLGRMVLRESFIVDGVSLVFGLALGLLFTKFFLLILGDILGLPDALPFATPLQAWVYTLIAFLLIFLVEALLMSVRIRRRGPKQMILGVRTRQKAPKASIVLSSLGLICLLAAYYIADFKSVQMLSGLYGVFIVLALVVFGTYLLFTQLLVWVLLRLRKGNLSGVALLAVTRLAYRMKDNARALTVIATLSAMVMTSMSSVIGVVHSGDTAERLDYPFSIMTWENAQHSLPMNTKEISNQLSSIGANKQTEVATQVISGPVLHSVHDGKNINVGVTLTKVSDYNHLLQTLRRTEPALAGVYKPVPTIQPGHAIFVAGFPLTLPKTYDKTSATLTIPNKHSEKLIVDKQINERVFNLGSRVTKSYELIVADSDYNKWARFASSSAVWNVHGWATNNRAQVDAAFKGKLPSTQVVTAPNSRLQKQFIRVMSTMIFAGIFIALLMLLACGNTLYFRLLNNQQADRVQFRSLRRLGLQKNEAGRVLTLEFSVLFFLPFVMAVIHTSAAMVDLKNLLNVPVRIWPACGAVMAAYFLFMLIYFIIARVTYLSRMNMDTFQRIE